MNNKINLNYLLSKNQAYTQAFMQNALMTWIQSPDVNEAKNRARLLDCIQVFSNYFQKTVMLRAILNDNDVFSAIVQQHLTEEFGHNMSLMHDRKDRAPIWDPILEACSCWFAWKMFTLDNIEKTVLIHLVLEASANVFFVEAHKIMTAYAETNYFKVHAAVDDHHEAMGIQLLEGLREIDYQHLVNVQQQGWEMINTVCNRMVELVKTS